MMKEKIEKFLSKKEGDGKMLPSHVRDAKLKVLKHLKDEMASMMDDKVGGLKKVTVASNSKEGLEEGMDKAQELLKGQMSGDPDAEEEACEDLSPEEHMAEEAAEAEGEMSPENESDLDAKIQELLKKKEALAKKMK